MHLGPHLGQHIGRPIPAKRRFENHLGFGTGGRDRLSQRHRVIRDVDLREDLALGAHAHDHRPAAMQVDTRMFFVHGNLLWS
jgi:hypothetical protein